MGKSGTNRKELLTHPDTTHFNVKEHTIYPLISPTSRVLPQGRIDLLLKRRDQQYNLVDKFQRVPMKLRLGLQVSPLF